MLEAIGCGMEKIPVADWAKYQGVLLGPGKRWLDSWSGAAKEAMKRARDIRGFGLGMVKSVVLYNSNACSCLAYLGRHARPPKEVLRMEEKAIYVLEAAPRHAMPPELLWGLHDSLALRIVPADLMKMSMASIFRFAEKRLPDLLRLQERLARARSGDEARWVPLHGGWQSRSCLADAIAVRQQVLGRRAWFGLPDAMPGSRSIDFRSTVEGARGRTWQSIFVARLEHWGRPAWHAEEWVAKIRELPSGPPPVLIYAGLKVACNAVVTSRRMGGQRHLCPFCRGRRRDKLLHLVRCKELGVVCAGLVPDLRPQCLEEDPLLCWAGLAPQDHGDRLVARLAVADAAMAAIASARQSGRPFASRAGALTVASARMTAVARMHPVVGKVLSALRSGPTEERWTPRRLEAAWSLDSSSSSSTSTAASSSSTSSSGEPE